MKLHYHLTMHFKYTRGAKTTVSTEQCYLAVGPTVVVDESCWTQPQLRTIFATTVHHREVILPRMQQHGLLLLTKFCDTAHQTRYLLILIPSGQKTSCKNCMRLHTDAQIFAKDGAKWMLSGPDHFSKFKKQPHRIYSHRGCTFHSSFSTWI